MSEKEKGFLEKSTNTLKKIKIGIGVGTLIIGLPTIAALAFLTAGGSWWFEKKLQQRRMRS